MANAKRNRRKKTRKGFDPTNTQVISYTLIGVGIAYLLALVSYTPNDVPGRLPFSGTSNLNTPPENFFGRLGAIGAGFSYWVIGAAGYLIPACLIWFGAAKLMFGARTSRRALIGFAMVILMLMSQPHLKRPWAAAGLIWSLWRFFRSAIWPGSAWRGIWLMGWVWPKAILWMIAPGWTISTVWLL